MPQVVDESDPPAKEGENKALQTSWGPDPEHRPHHQTQIAAGHMDQQTLENPSVRLKMRATHPAGLIAVSERPLQ
jgi:hypothetical protein